MKRIIILITVFLIPFLASSQGIIFTNLSYDEAISKAKTDNKLIFVDCYTTWCGPCKTLAKNTFPLKEAGDYFNQSFICVKIDMEKGEGPKLVERLGIKAYPTMIIADGEGNIIGKITGSMGIKVLIDRIEAAKENPSYKLDLRYDSGKMSVEEKLNYIDILMKASERNKAKDIAQKLLDNVSDEEKISKTYWRIYSSRLVYYGTVNFKFIVDNKKKFSKIVDEEIVDKKIFSNYSASLMGSIWGNFAQDIGYSDEKLAEIKKEIKKLKIKNKNILLAQVDLAIARGKNDGVKMAKCLKSLMPIINDGDLWGYGSSFIKVFKANIEVVNELSVKEIGQVFIDKAKDNDKIHYKRIFKIM